MSSKRVIIVGNAPTVLLNEYGSKIDEFDIVIRINDYEIDKYEKHVGNKVDIHTRAKNHEMRPRSVHDFKEIWLKDGWQKVAKMPYNYLPYDDMGSDKIKLVVPGKKKFHDYKSVRKFKQSVNLPHLSKVNVRRISKSTGYVAIERAIEKYWGGDKNNPITIYGFNFQNVKDVKLTKTQRPHYYKYEPPNSYDILTTKLDSQNHVWELERYLIQKLIKENKIKPLFEPEIFNDDVDLSHLEPCIKHTPTHLIGKVNPKTDKHY